MNNDKVSRAITVYVQGNACNLQCDYCYYNNSNPSEKTIKAKIEYPLDVMISAFSPERIGGVADVTIIGSTETLLTEEVIPFVHGLLGLGHVVTVVTNATITERISKLIDCPMECKKNLILKCSFHYRELIKKQLMDVYFSNIKMAVAAGVSAYPFVVICPDYVGELENIGNLIQENLGTKAHCSPCLDIKNAYDLKFGAAFNPEPSENLHEVLEKNFDMRIFDECVKYKQVDVQNSFCYAGCWSVVVDFATGIQRKCHGYPAEIGSFYDNVENLYKWGEPVAMSCGIESCALQYNFFSEGLLPDYKSTYTYGQILYQPKLISKYVRDKLNVKFNKVHERLSVDEENRITLKNKNSQIKNLVSELKSNPFSNPIIREKIEQGKKIAVYGVGTVYDRYKDTIDFSIDCYLETYADGNKTINSIKVIKPDELAEMTDDYFVVVAVENKQMLYDYLEKVGFDKQSYC